MTNADDLTDEELAMVSAYLQREWISHDVQPQAEKFLGLDSDRIGSACFRPRSVLSVMVLAMALPDDLPALCNPALIQ